MALHDRIEIPSHERLCEVLDTHQISTAHWGERGTRTTADLYEELAHGESALFLAAIGLIRYGASVKVRVYHTTDSKQLQLVERRQFDRIKGTSRYRGLHNSLSEKRRFIEAEEPCQAALRGMREELRGPNGEQIIDEPLSLTSTAQRVWPPKYESFNYPGLLAINETDYFTAQLRPEQFDPAGYCEPKLDAENNIIRMTYFRWEDAAPGSSETL